MRFAPLVAILLLFAAAPTATAQKPVDSCSEQCAPTDPDVNDGPNEPGEPTNVIMYGHFEDILNMAPMNLVPPDPVNETDLAKGFMMPVMDTNTGVCPAGGTTCADFHFKNNVFSMFFCPGIIEFLQEGWRTNCHTPSPADLIEVAGPIVVYSYFSADAAPSASGPYAPPSTGVGVMPNVRVHAGLFQREKHQSSPEQREPILIADGYSEIATLVARPGEPSVYEFKTEIAPPAGTDGFRLGKDFVEIRFEIEQVAADEPESDVAQSHWRLHTGARYPPRAVIPVVEPLIPKALTTTYEGVVYARYSILSPFGAYEILPENVHAALVGPKGGPEAPQDALTMMEFRLRPYDHDGVHKPANVTWRIDHSKLEGDASDYTLMVWATNLQGTYTVHDEIRLPVTEFDGAAALPAPGALGVLLLLGIVVFASRRFGNR